VDPKKLDDVDRKQSNVEKKHRINVPEQAIQNEEDIACHGH
jgi:hypothetical protein